VNLLLDTCTFLWLTLEPTRLSANAAQLLADPANTFRLSVVSAWEVSMLYGRGRVTLTAPPRQFVTAECRRNGLSLLPLYPAAAFLEYGLPRHHRDPFDRMRICQALVGSLTLLTPDPHITLYPVPTAW
jgi:PIN domain nuclease of toxin-antitoxin system